MEGGGSVAPLDWLAAGGPDEGGKDQRNQEEEPSARMNSVD